jgi:hypothetical protein
LPGDYNRNQVVDGGDYIVWQNTLGNTVTPFSGADGSGNGVIDQADYDIWRENIGSSTLPPALPGDYSHNGVVDAADFVMWRKTMGSNVLPYSGADGNGNALIDRNDYDVWRSHFGMTLPQGGATGQSVPENGTASQPLTNRAPAPFGPKGQAASAAGIAAPIAAAVVEGSDSAVPARALSTGPQFADTSSGQQTSESGVHQIGRSRRSTKLARHAPDHDEMQLLIALIESNRDVKGRDLVSIASDLRQQISRDMNKQRLLDTDAAFESLFGAKRLGLPVHDATR